MKDDIRVKIDKKYKNVYDDLKAIAVDDAHGLFCMAICLAAAKKLKPIPIVKRYDAFWSKTITPNEWSCYYAIVLNNNEMKLKSIEDDNAVIIAMEPLANAGVKFIVDEILTENIRISNGVISIDIKNKEEVVKSLLFELFTECTEHVDA